MYVRVLLLCFLFLGLEGCAAYGKYHMFSDGAAKYSDNTTFYSDYYISSTPSITMKSNCSGKIYSVSFGPFFIVPLPIFPHIEGILDLNNYDDIEGFIRIEIEAPPNKEYIKDSIISLFFDGEVIEASSSKIDETYWKIAKTFTYDLNSSCKDIINRNISVKYLSENESIVSKDIKIIEYWKQTFP